MLRVLEIFDDEEWTMLAVVLTLLILVMRWKLGVEDFTVRALLFLSAMSALFICLGRTEEPYRLLSCIILGGPCLLAYWLFGDPWPYSAASIVLLGIATALAIPREAAPPQAYGSAHWAGVAYLRWRGLLTGAGIRLGRVSDGKTEHVLSYNGDRHLLTVAPTRAGKGVCAIIPNLLTYEGSALVIDPKGENAMITAAARRAMGQEIHVVDPWGIAALFAAPARFNPLDWLQPGDVDITENATLLADALVVPQSHGDQFWREEAKALLQGFILYVATDEREQNARHLGRVRDLLLLESDELQKLFARMADSPHHVVASTGARCLQKEERLLANVLASAQAETHFLDSARIRDSLSVSDFRFEDLKSRAMTVYLVLPADRLNAFGRWLRLLIQQAITVNARNIAAKPKQPVLFLLDEMPALGRLAMVEQAYGLMAGFGMQLWGIAQDLSQLKRLYGDGWETFISNAGAVQYFGSRDRMTAEYFSALCGVSTIETISEAISRGARSKSRTQTISLTQRKLAFADELMRLPAHMQLVFVENHPPVRARKVAWFDDPALAGHQLLRDLKGQDDAGTGKSAR